MMATAACSPAPDSAPEPAAAVESDAAAEAEAHAAHDAYVAAINSNDVEAWLAILTDDIVYMAPNAPLLKGKDELRPWGEGYFGAYTTQWDKTSLEFVVMGDWAFERYAYTVTDTPKDGSEPLHDVGKGINIYHKDADGVWRVARDAWNSDLPLPTPQ
jgi:ketosteroid isomerase-like protein